MSDKEQITGVLREFADKEVNYEIEELAEAIEKAIRPSFSQTVIENNCLKRRCSLGHLHAVYPHTWRKEYVTILRLFRGHGAMTTSGVGRFFSGQTARKCPSELVHYGLLSQSGIRGGDRLYRLTTLGEDFLDGRQRVPEKVWKRDVELPSECKDGELRYIHELVPKEHTKPAIHVEQAVMI